MLKTISIFVDESGDFGKYSRECPYYFITMVFHNQNKPIGDEFEKLNARLRLLGRDGHILHTGPLVRKEEVYYNMDIQERMKILMSFFTVFNKLDIKYHTFIVQKYPDFNKLQVIRALSKQINEFVVEFPEIFTDNKIIVYYDNGQEQVTQILASVFGCLNCDFRVVQPGSYRLFQIADLITTLELINYKKNNMENSNSEKHFFGSISEFNKNFYKKIIKKKI